MLFLAFLFIALAILLFWLAKREQNAAGLPQGRVIYADTSRWSPVESPLYDARSGLTGRPDYLVDDGDYIIPVEVKSSQIHARPYDSHIFQLAAYCRLVERTYAQTTAIWHHPLSQPHICDRLLPRAGSRVRKPAGGNARTRYGCRP